MSTVSQQCWSTVTILLKDKSQYSLQTNMLLALRLKQAGLTLGVETANLEVLTWLRDVATVRVHHTTQAVATERWQQEVAALLPEPLPPKVTPLRRVATPVPTAHPFEAVDLQHPLSVYEVVLREGLHHPDVESLVRCVG